MKLTKKNYRPFALLITLGLLTGTLAWEIFERVLLLVGANIDLGVGPIGLDLDVLAVYIKVNPGSLLGAGAGAFVFTRL
jgi:hypothetical protein